MCGLALLCLLLLDTEHVRIIGAVVVAGEEVSVLLAEAGVVTGGAAVYLSLFSGDTGIEHPRERKVSAEDFGQGGRIKDA